MPRGDTARRLGITITSDRHARRIAADWQSPGNIGHVLATLASGIPVEREALWIDVDTTLHHDNPDGRNRAELEALQIWADDGDSPLLKGES